MKGERRLIVNADDFGMSEGVNRGILRAHERGIVTSASLMVDREGAEEAAARARTAPAMSVGLHVDLGEWAIEDDAWIARYEVAPLDDAAGVADAARRQLERFRRLVGREPTHLDSHQHVHREEPARSILRAMAHELDVPLRHEPSVRHRGDFYGLDRDGTPLPGALESRALIAILESIGPGVTELACHPGEGLDPRDAYTSFRARELRTLCDAAVRAAIEATGVRLCSFADRPWEATA